MSKVPNFEGRCSPTWVNSNQIDHRLDGGVTAFFRILKQWGPFLYHSGEEFHGIIRNGKVYTTKGLY